MSEIIARFMGGKILNTEHHSMPHGSCHDLTIKNWSVPAGTPSSYISQAKIGIFNYHNSWECLIPVIEKIENIEIDDEVYRFVIHKNTSIIEAQLVFFQPSSIWHIHLKNEGINKIDATYKSIIQFINWYQKLQNDRK